MNRAATDTVATDGEALQVWGGRDESRGHGRATDTVATDCEALQVWGWAR